MCGASYDRAFGIASMPKGDQGVNAQNSRQPITNPFASTYAAKTAATTKPLLCPDISGCTSFQRKSGFGAQNVRRNGGGGQALTCGSRPFGIKNPYVFAAQKHPFPGVAHLV
ncbi:hypothetical protein SAZ10_18925 [Mesorhizobium sp. BAC0120]|uniref:hypothetical protein n=1 Tax=Mesorhizobium sp. BAC0120 TaxID=3090670 RepID=UPI00298BCA2A|nr:hypothetical protein [Mesorhizobium sp. BAC0120]MDW6023827.1 hypothetical protein [Mesorhizobium sp. BAC0120]